MPAIHDKVVEDLCARVQTMLTRHMCLAHFHMTHRECLETIARPDHIDALMSLADVAKVPVYAEWVQVATPFELDGTENLRVQFYMRTHESKLPPLLPRFASWRYPGTSITARVADWMNTRLVNGRLAATTQEIIKHLSHSCDSGQQIRYMYPAILHLAALSDHDRTKAWVAKFGAHKAVKSTPPVEPFWRKAMIETSTWLTQASLLDEVTGDDSSPTCIALPDPLPSFKLGPYNVTRV